MRRRRMAILALVCALCISGVLTGWAATTGTVQATNKSTTPVSGNVTAPVSSNGTPPSSNGTVVLPVWGEAAWQAAEALVPFMHCAGCAATGTGHAPGCGGVGPRLFKNLYYGMPLEQVRAMKKLVPGDNTSAQPGEENWAETDPVAFAGMDWTATYFFGDGKLYAVSLTGRDLLDEREQAAMDAFEEAGFVPMEISWLFGSFEWLEHKHLTEARWKELFRMKIDQCKNKEESYHWDFVERTMLAGKLATAGTISNLYALGRPDARGGGGTPSST